MKRILVIGGNGSGKSTFSKKLGEKTGLPVVHLDKIFWRGNWEYISREEFDVLLENELKKEEWIIDGNFERTLEERMKFCDTVFYFDFSTVQCLFGVTERVLKNYGKTREEVFVMLLDDKNKLIKCSKLFDGIENLTKIEIKKIVSFAIVNNATKVILSHNHPMGLALPSSADYNTTKRLYEALEMMNIQLCDHIIVADDDFVSLADSGFFARFKY